MAQSPDVTAIATNSQIFAVTEPFTGSSIFGESFTFPSSSLFEGSCDTW
jgi:hypothetical protein